MISIYEVRGREAGREEGREEGILIGKRGAVLKLLRLKFRELPPFVETSVQKLSTEAELDALFEHTVSANTLQDVGFEAE